jgi:hypothetical protein
MDPLKEYQSSSSVPTSVAAVPPITIHMLRVTLVISIGSHSPYVMNYEDGG